ncbi:MAG: metal-dependent transcriptional regulator [Desulfobulbaceae bacterium]|nr:metal-dependent transcriptional regulator [Desulfobulbaceae bacterium]HIJ79377.1 metal-dependent transcriptional regulator [Deltaproteobacteria bacterium]
MKLELEREMDECVEQLWYLQEKELDSMDDLASLMKGEFCLDHFKEMAALELVDLSRDGKIFFTDAGEKYAARLIRSHRLAERLVYDVLGGEFEAGACEFEHISNPELVDSICTLLGHPRECPHGMPIPGGECCEKSLRTATSSVTPLTELKVGESARVAYINCRDDRRLHKLDSLQIRPGTMLKLHQISPSFVVECEGANIAMDESICSDICLWKSSPLASSDSAEALANVKTSQTRAKFLSFIR